MFDDLTGDIADWLPHQRWYAGKGRPTTAHSVETAAMVAKTDDAELYDVIVRVDYRTGHSDRYQLVLGLRDELPQRLEYATVGRVDHRLAYDAVHDPELMGALLTGMAENRLVAGITFRHLEGAQLATRLPSRLLTGEQSNSSVIYADRYILKLFRKVAPGANPDLEISRLLARAGSPHVAVPLGWFEGPVEGEPATLGLLQPFFVSATEGWALATTSVRDLYAEGDLHADEVGGDFAAEAARLGAATAEVHAVLAEALPTETAGAEERKWLAARMRERLDVAIAEVPQLTPYAAALQTAYDEVEALTGPTLLQRIHGDYHLGQALRTDTGWVILDFEGEPAKPLAERVAPDSPLRDVAGMLRSFDYAARFLLAERNNPPALAYRATEWAERNRAAFCDGYTAEAGHDPRTDDVLLRAYELDKAVYEVMYEARMRPTWLPIPLGSIERLVEQA